MGRGTLACVALAGCGRVDFIRLDAAADAATLACPIGMVAIVGSAQLGTADFCVHETEARAWLDANGDSAIDFAELDDDGCGSPACDVNWGGGTHLPVSVRPAPPPWRSVNALTAQAACRALGANFDLIANREWMTIARDAELDGRNWSGGVPGSGRMVEGNTDGGAAPAISDASDEYSDTGNDASQLPDVGWEQRRTLYLSNGTVVWDIPGDIQEWIDWTAGGALDPPPSCASGELPGYSCAGLAPDDFQSTTGTYSSVQGVGKVIGGSGNAGRRGGQNGDRPDGYAGIYGFNMNRSTSDVFAGTGFRCVYRP